MDLTKNDNNGYLNESDITFKQYEFHKSRLKRWQNEFFKQNKKKPDKNDVKFAGEDIENSFNVYTRYKMLLAQNKYDSKSANNSLSAQQPSSGAIWNDSLKLKPKIQAVAKANLKKKSDSPISLKPSKKINSFRNYVKNDIHTCRTKSSEDVHNVKLQTDDNFFEINSPTLKNTSLKVISTENTNTTLIQRFNTTQQITNKCLKVSFDSTNTFHTNENMYENNEVTGKMSFKTSDELNSLLGTENDLQQCNSISNNKRPRPWGDSYDNHVEQPSKKIALEITAISLENNDDKVLKNSLKKKPILGDEENSAACTSKMNDWEKVPALELSTKPFNLSDRNSNSLLINGQPNNSKPSNNAKTNSDDLNLTVHSNHISASDDNLCPFISNKKYDSPYDRPKGKNDNFIKVNLKKKKYSGGKKPFNYATFKNKQWKQNRDKSIKFDSYNSCSNSKSLKKTQENFELTDLENLLNNDSNSIYEENLIDQKFSNNILDEEPVKLTQNDSVQIKPYFELEQNGKIPDTPKEIFESLNLFGYESFRPGQEKAIMNILSGSSTLIISHTGSGKSLCYQLPAFIFSKRSKCLTLVVSPLLSLIDDQLANLPKFLSAASYSSNLSSAKRKKVLKNLKDCKIDVLFVSPETIAANGCATYFIKYIQSVATISFVCIDEVHCLSQWSHNFRPSYLIVCNVLKEVLGVNRFMGITATASSSIIAELTTLFEIKDNNAGVILHSSFPSNLTLTISKDIQKEDALIKFVKHRLKEQHNSMIVYCTRREDCFKVSNVLRTSLRQASFIDNKLISNISEPYHAGLTAQKRRSVQNAFMKGEIRIIVATVAFGMGINKPDIRSVIHYNMPSSLENYVQEVGRAGRDGKPAFCHMFLSPELKINEQEILRHIFANVINKQSVKYLVQKVFTTHTCDCSTEICLGHEVIFSIEDTILTLDLSEEMIVTLLCYIQIYFHKYINLLPQAFMYATVKSKSGFQAIQLAQKKSSSLSAAINQMKVYKNYSENISEIKIPILQIARCLGWTFQKIIQDLKRLEFETAITKSGPPSLSVEFNTLGFHMKVYGNLSEDVLNEIVATLMKQNIIQKNLRLQKLESISSISQKLSFETVDQCMTVSEDVQMKSVELRKSIQTYFQENVMKTDGITNHTTLTDAENIKKSIENLILSYGDERFNSHSISRIFHGIQSPRYPALQWYKCKYWRAYIHEDFDALNKLAEDVLRNFKIK
uniref:DNA 3'-5' helicase n=1 Tax=Trichogramma kaykai TaxID=54128 RepID=A0ABD2X3C1_9HYME